MKQVTKLCLTAAKLGLKRDAIVIQTQSTNTNTKQLKDEEKIRKT